MNEAAKTVVILGMHRSGSSIFGAILHALGVDMGQDAYGATAYNPTGHFEDKDIVSINNKILKDAGGSWDSPPGKEQVMSAASRYSSKITAALTREGNIFGFKDPRTCITIDAWFPYLSNPCFIVCRRNEKEIAASLTKRNGWPSEKGIELARCYERHIKEFLVDNSMVPILEISYEDLVNQPSNNIKKIAEFLQIHVDENRLENAISLVIPRRMVGKQRYKYMLLKGIREPKKILPNLLMRLQVWLQRLRNAVG